LSSIQGLDAAEVVVLAHGKRSQFLLCPGVAIAFIVLVAVGCDCNLLLLSRYRQEIGAGIQTGLIRTMGSSGNVAITAGFVFAITMLALLSSDVVNIGQAGSTICVGLMFDMLIVRLFLVMPLARLLGPWFWWPQRVPRRPGLVR
jgi:putative drug exporter of the RND superfamily